MDQRDERPIPANALDGNVVALLDSKPDDKLLLLRRCELRVEGIGAGQMAAGYLKRDTFWVSERRTARKSRKYRYRYVTCLNSTP